MFIAIVGTRFAGKSSVHDYLVSQGFVSLRLCEGASSETVASTPASADDHLKFGSTSDLLDYVTLNWRTHFTTTDIQTREQVEAFVKRPFFMLVNVDAPLLERYRRCKSVHPAIPLDDFVQENDHILYGTPSATNLASACSSLQSLKNLINLTVVNAFCSLSDFYNHLSELDLTHRDHLRPNWDTYFMTLASLASHRSNCMKRRVGAIIVRNKRIVSTGYNGTPIGLLNCHEGGCHNCNGTLTDSGVHLECICLHAEENALLEAGRERIGSDAVLYCNTCPCMKCTVKIIQSGLKEVVYSLSYKVDDESAKLMEQAGVVLRRYDPREHAYHPAPDTHQHDGLASLIPGIKFCDI